MKALQIGCGWFGAYQVVEEVWLNPPKANQAAKSKEAKAA